jgi:hypothetical protein
VARFTREAHEEERVCSVCQRPLPAGADCYEPVAQTIEDKDRAKLEAKGLDVGGFVLCDRCFAAIATGYTVRHNWLKRLLMAEDG